MWCTVHAEDAMSDRLSESTVRALRVSAQVAGTILILMAVVRSVRQGSIDVTYGRVLFAVSGGILLLMGRFPGAIPRAYPEFCV